MYTLHFDGLYRSSWYRDQAHSLPRDIMCYGWLVEKNKRVIAQGHGGLLYKNYSSSNCAEYIALIEGLEALRDLGIEHEEIRIIGDAKSVIDQMTGESKVSSDQVKLLYQKAVRLSRWFDRIQWLWTPRKLNRDADQLTRKALNQIRLSGEFTRQPRIFNKRKGIVPLLDLRMILRPI
jgi:ribonuclease HI